MIILSVQIRRLVSEHLMLHLQVKELICSSRINLNLNVAICMFQKQFVCRSRRSLVAVAIIYLYLVKKISLIPNSQLACVQTKLNSG